MLRRFAIFFAPFLLIAQESSKPTLFIIGDSTVNNHTGVLLGWGDPIKAYFDASKINVENKARGGRSSKTFINEGLWDQVLAAIQPGDFVMMQFGHNDGGSIDDPKDRASLKGTGDETRENAKYETIHTYGWYMRKYIADTKAKSANPIVLSPVPRNIWKDGKVVRASMDYGKWARGVAESAGAVFVDLNEIVAAHYEEIGEDTVRTQFFAEDHTHTTKAGAELNAASVIEGLRAQKDGLLMIYLK